MCTLLPIDQKLVVRVALYYFVINSLHEEVDTSRRRITFIDEEKDILEKVRILLIMFFLKKSLQI